MYLVEAGVLSLSVRRDASIGRRKGMARGETKERKKPQSKKAEACDQVWVGSMTWRRTGEVRIVVGRGGSDEVGELSFDS